MNERTAARLLLPEQPGIVCLVGAGGKTSLMFQLARELSAQGKRVLTTTTTKIFRPEPRQSSLTVLSEDPLSWLEKHHSREKAGHLTLAGKALDRNKLQGFTPETIEHLWLTWHFDWILVEADGAAGRPIKAPAAHEPVIPKATCCVIAVLGLQGFGRPLSEEWCFRPHIFSELSGLGLGETMDPGSLLRVLTHEQGLLKGTPAQAERFLFLNQADDVRLQERAHRFLHRLEEEHPGHFSRSAFGSLQQQLILNR